MRHFLKILFIFLGMIILGLIGVFLVSFLNEEKEKPVDSANSTFPINFQK